MHVSIFESSHLEGSYVGDLLYLFICLFVCFLLAMPRGLGDLSSLTGDCTRAHGSESAESQPLDGQGIPQV